MLDVLVAHDGTPALSIAVIAAVARPAVSRAGHAQMISTKQFRHD
jgi:hypothetical protein